ERVVFFAEVEEPGCGVFAADIGAFVFGVGAEIHTRSGAANRVVWTLALVFVRAAVRGTCCDRARTETNRFGRPTGKVYTSPIAADLARFASFEIKIGAIRTTDFVERT